MLTVTPVCAALLAVLFLVLSGRVILYRRSKQISLGDWGDPEMVKRARVHGNFAEYAPFGLVLVVLVELMGGAGLLVHGLAAALLAGRVFMLQHLLLQRRSWHFGWRVCY